MVHVRSRDGTCGFFTTTAAPVKVPARGGQRRARQRRQVLSAVPTMPGPPRSTASRRERCRSDKATKERRCSNANRAGAWRRPAARCMPPDFVFVCGCRRRVRASTTTR
jgi:hypothetical protein